MLSIVCLLATISLVQGDYAFLGIGDWGGAAVDTQYYNNVYAVAAQMDTTAQASSAKFVINTGDNFYWCGIQNTSDYQIAVDFETPYKAASLQVPWYSALGNHEYGYNVTAQIEYTKLSSTWYMPARYFTKRIQLEGSNYATLVFLDTSPCVSDYRNSNPDGWDPCSTEYPTCSLDDTNDDFEGACYFHENILSQNCNTQYDWLQNVLLSIPTDDWVIAVGHHPIDECDVKDLTSLLQQRGFSIYLNGHTHTLNQYSVDGASNYVTTGAGSMVNTADQSHKITSAKLTGVQDLKNSLGHSYSSIWNSKVAGFTLHTFNSDFTTLRTDYLKYDGSIVHTFTVDKKGAIVTSA